MHEGKTTKGRNTGHGHVLFMERIAVVRSTLPISPLLIFVCLFCLFFGMRKYTCTHVNLIPSMLSCVHVSERARVCARERERERAASSAFGAIGIMMCMYLPGVNVNLRCLLHVSL